MRNPLGINLSVLFFIVSQATIFSRLYTADLDLNNKKSNNEPLGETEAHSKTRCAVMCQKECRIFGYNPVMKKCRTHKTIFTSNTSEEAGWRYFYFVPIDCKDLLENGHTNTGVYEIYPFGTRTIPIRVYCYMTTMGGGWTAIQKRIDGSLTFDKNWNDYKNGFGTPEQNVWIGNDVIHQLTKGHNSLLYISITLSNGTTLYELYDQFSISDEADKYQLFLSGPATGTLGDRMLDTGTSSADLSGMSFSTLDRDHDKRSGNCAVIYGGGGGWWYNSCNDAYLNGQWSDWYEPWYPPFDTGDDITETLMMIRRH